jgi:glucose-1-phosphate adenylyltransferase
MTLTAPPHGPVNRIPAHGHANPEFRNQVGEVVAMVLAGGEGKRLYPLTRDRAKPAVPFGGRYRLIDFVLSNLVNSGIYRLNVLTQYKAGSLMQHLARGWQLAPQMGHYVAPVPASMKTGREWFRGSADAIYQNLDLIENESPTEVCVFGADHIYKMDVVPMLAAHRERDADVTVAAMPVPAAEASRYGIVEVDADGRITDFFEKPPSPPGAAGPRLASMGLYVFSAEALTRAVTADAARSDSGHDFGGDVLPRLVESDRVFVYDFSTNDVPGMAETERAYWRDVGSIDAYWQASQDLVSVSPAFSLYNPQWPIYSAYYPNPPAKFVFADEAHNRVGIATDSMVSEGSIISGGQVERSILGARVRINSFSHVSESILFDGVEVGRHARIRRAIIDKHVVVPAGMTIGYDLEEDRRRFTVSADGVVVVPRRADLTAFA